MPQEKRLSSPILGSLFRPMSTVPLVRCPQCGAQIPEGQTSCSSCDRQPKPLVPATRDVRERVAAVACYFTPFPALLLLNINPYRHSVFVRFHAFQSIIIGIIVVVAVALGALLASLGATILWLMVGLLFFVALFFVWLVLSIKAGLGFKFPLPFIGNIAEKRAAR